MSELELNDLQMTGGVVTFQGWPPPTMKVTSINPLDAQVGGSHYKKYKIQPVEYAMANGLNYCQANAVKYITRYKDKGGIEDLNKAIHNIEILIELENNGRLE